MTLRNFIEIDEEKCDGCGDCVVACAEGALEIVDGKAKVVRESFCDGLGACIGHCPRDALRIVRKDVEEFDEEAVEENLKGGRECPGASFTAGPHPHVAGAVDPLPLRGRGGGVGLGQWPIQLHLVSAEAPYFKGANLVVAASCSAFSMGAFHDVFLTGKKLVIACPKLDRTEGYVEKLAEIIKVGEVASVTVARMEVPCCGGLTALVKKAIEVSGRKVPFLEQIISLKGEVL